MKLTLASSYALVAVVHIAQQNSKEALASHKIALARDIPKRFLLKVLKPLVSVANPPVLKSVKGPQGGYTLARAASDISVLEIIEAVDGPLRGYAPLTEKINSAVNSKLETFCQDTADVVRKHLKKVRISDLMGGKKVKSDDD